MPHDLPYVKCDPCIEAGPAVDHPDCKGTDETEPLCACRCKWLEIYEGD